ncbi:50S ribosomal protein L22 [Candidatus Protochlamydia naegleriophila]|uniref:Large ribosomal subunit protein uL22 n=1 Tax=Candidatus Protochlamydia naegleriophila TaxID=389348 RepID=A0A0U5JEI0_9BACT|nr:50S ribosomal protein L22 [Candidatus Protochlamydia naegleriophila]CUI17559.1 50S ribosomal protein L22 [Candidatus Protochlamydia naegleriophila]
MNYAKAISKYIRISPRKARLAAGLIRGLSVSEASVQLTFSNLRAGRLLKKTLDSAVANAETQLDMRRENLKVVEVRVDEGPTLKRAKPKNRGGRHPIMKRTSHFTVIVSNL